MEMILEDSSAFNQIFERYMADRDDVVRRAQETYVIGHISLVAITGTTPLVPDLLS